MIQIDQHVTAEQPVVEDEVDKVVIAVKREPFLSSLKQESLAKLQQKVLDLQQIEWLRDRLPFAGQLVDAGLVPAESQTFVETAVELPLEFADRPILTGSFDLVEASLVRVFDTEEEDVVRPAQDEWAGCCGRQLLGEQLGNRELARR